MKNNLLKLSPELKGGLLIIDYGSFEHKMNDTLQAVTKHKKVKIIDNIGKADITYKINFKLIEKIIKKLKLKKSGFSTQGNFELQSFLIMTS